MSPFRGDAPRIAGRWVLVAPSWLLVGLAAGAIAGGGAATVAVLMTSGPLADSGNEQVSSETPTATSTQPATPIPSPTAAGTSTPSADDRLEPDERFDPLKLPTVDTTGWVEHTGPRGSLTVRAPADWRVETREQMDYTGSTVVGDFAKVLHVAHPSSEFTAAPGDVWADIATESEPVTYSTERKVFYQVRLSTAISGHPAEVTVTQFEPPLELFEPGAGAITFFVSAKSPSGAYLNAAVHVALPADLKTVAQALAILTEIELK
jgi:hypothetical protein